MLYRWLFETEFGQRLVTWIERRTHLALVPADWLGGRRAGYPGGVK